MISTRSSPHIRRFPGLSPYLPVYQAMQDFTARRDAATPDQLWVVEHQPVYTLGLAAKRTHVLEVGNIPVQQTDRGGQVTYHGPGQLVVYVLLDLRRAGWYVKPLVQALEQALIDFLAACGVTAQRRAGAPGVYVNDAKIAALGLRVRRQCSYHGLSLNVDMDLTPFQGINPCGYPGLAVTQLRDLGVPLSLTETTERFLPYLLRGMGFN